MLSVRILYFSLKWETKYEKNKYYKTLAALMEFDQSSNSQGETILKPKKGNKTSKTETFSNLRMRQTT